MQNKFILALSFPEGSLPGNYESKIENISGEIFKISSDCFYIKTDVPLKKFQDEIRNCLVDVEPRVDFYVFAVAEVVDGQGTWMRNTDFYPKTLKR